MRTVDANALIKVKFNLPPYTHIVPVDLPKERAEVYERGWNDAVDAIMECAETVEPQQWIPVSERLPKPNELNGDVRRFYLVQNKYGDMMVASFNKSSASECTWWEQIYQYGEELSDIVAWMSLPESWKRAKHD